MAHDIASSPTAGPTSKLKPTALAALMAATCLGGCGPLGPPPQESHQAGSGDTSDTGAGARAPAPPIVVTERGPRGGRLVFVDESGARRMALTELGAVPVRDNSPAWSPDGRWVVFASSRAREGLLRTSLWIIAAQPDAQPRRLTSGQADDRDPVWLPDGSAVVFASSRGGSFDLWRQPLTMSRYGWPVAAGAPEQLTRSARHALHPSVSPDGARIVYTEVDFDSGRSALWMWQGGQTHKLTAGPADATPAWSPDGRIIAFAGLAVREDGGPDTDLFLVDADGGNRRALVKEALAGQSHPVWSRDGRYLFSTSLYRAVESGKPVLSSVTFVDLEERPPVLRALHDPAVVESRAGTALARQALDAEALRKNQPYDRALMQAVEQVIIRSESRRPRSEDPR